MKEEKNVARTNSWSRYIHIFKNKWNYKIMDNKDKLKIKDLWKQLYLFGRQNETAPSLTNQVLRDILMTNRTCFLAQEMPLFD